MDAGYRLLAAQYVRKQAKQLRAQLAGIRAGEDIEFVHRRVASRRLRSATGMFEECFKAKQVKRWKKAIRRILSQLSEARDKDVHLELLRGILASLTDQACFAGISRLLIEWEYRRESLQRNVVKAVKRLRRSGALQAMNRAAKRILTKVEPGAAQVQSPACFALAEEEIFKRLEQLLALQDCLDRPDDQQSHHAMRIALKHLRYSLEIAGPIYNGRLDASLDGIKQLQTLLGEVHDCDVWQEQLDQFVKTQTERIIACFGHARPFSRLNTGIEYLRQDRLRRREECFQSLVSLWKEFDAQEIWENLVSIVQSYRQPCAAAEAAEKQQTPPQSAAMAKETTAAGQDTAKGADGNGNQKDSPALLPPQPPCLGKKPAGEEYRPPCRTPVIS